MAIAPKPGHRRTALPRLLAWFAVLLCSVPGQAFAQSSSFTYQGRLTDSALVPVTGSHDFAFTLWDAADGGAELGTLDIPAVAVDNGLFVTTLDFGTLPYDGGPLFLEVAVKRADQQDYTVLTPRQPIQSAPYAVRALEAAVAESAGVAAAATHADDALQLGGRLPGEYQLRNGDGGELTGLNASALATGTVADARLPPTVARTDAAQTFIADQSIAGNLTVGGTIAADSMVARRFQVSVNPGVAWLIDSAADYVTGDNINPDLTLKRGMTYQFVVGVDGYPFRIASTANGPPFNTGVSNNDAMNGTLTIKVPMDAPSYLHYYCTSDPFMSGVIYVD